MLFLGNSYTFFNDLELTTAALFAAAGEEVQAERLANAGWRFVDHIGAIETADSGHEVAFSEARDWVILQEQSQIPGFPEGQPDREESRDAAVTLDGYVAGTGAETMFLMTWGRRDGDRDNAALYPDYTTMQALLTEGYLGYVDLASADGTQAYVAPAGLAWGRIHADVLATGEDPLAPGSAFYDLYVDDGSHPSPRGTYLAACVVYASITGNSPEGLAAPDTVPDAAYLQEVAAAVVLDGEGIVYPWSSDVPDDTGDTGPSDTDTGPSDTDTANTATDTADTATDSADAASDPTPDDPDGCACAASRPAAAWAGIPLFALALTRRRARRG